MFNHLSFASKRLRHDELENVNSVLIDGKNDIENHSCPDVKIIS